MSARQLFHKLFQNCFSDETITKTLMEWGSPTVSPETLAETGDVLVPLFSVFRFSVFP